MNSERIEYIKKLIDELKVTDYEEHDVMCNSSFLKIKSGKYKLNNGKYITRERVTKRSNGMNAVVVFAVTKSKKIIMVVQPRVFLPTNNKITIELPAGYVEDGEDVIEAGKRELLEETGYISDKYLYVDKFYPSLGYSGESISIILACDCVKEQDQELDSDEFLKYFEVSFDEFKYLFFNDYVIDATTKLTYYEVMNYLKDNDMLDIIGDSNV